MQETQFSTCAQAKSQDADLLYPWSLEWCNHKVYFVCNRIACGKGNVKLYIILLKIIKWSLYFNEYYLKSIKNLNSNTNIKPKI